LTWKLLNEHNFTNDHLEILAELFYAQAEISFAKGNFKESLGFYEKALILIDFVVKESKTFSMEKQSKIALLKDRIENLKNK
jgi:hypothetical protein